MWMWKLDYRQTRFDESTEKKYYERINTNQSLSNRTAASFITKMGRNGVSRGGKDAVYQPPIDQHRLEDITAIC